MMQNLSKRVFALITLLALALSVIVPIDLDSYSPESCPVAEMREQMPVGEVNFCAYPANHRHRSMPKTEFALFVFGNGSYSRKQSKREP